MAVMNEISVVVMTGDNHSDECVSDGLSDDISVTVANIRMTLEAFEVVGAVVVVVETETIK